MRYRFRGLRRDTGKAVEGHAHAPSEQIAYSLISDNGIVTETLWPDPPPAASATSSGTEPTVADQQAALVQGALDLGRALDSALDTASRQVNVDSIAQRFRGKQVWVIDRDKIRRNIMQIIDGAIKQSAERKETVEEVRERIAGAVDRMFQDNRNLTSRAEQGSEALERQIIRLSRVVQGVERAVAGMATVLRTGGGGGAGGGGSARFTHEQRHRTEDQNAVLLEIFEDNLELQRRLEENPNATTLDTKDVTIPLADDGASTASDAAVDDVLEKNDSVAS